MSQESRGVGRRLIDAVLVVAVEDHGWRGCVDQSLDTLGPAGGEDVLGTGHIHPFVVAGRSPDPGASRHMEDDVTVGGCPGHRFLVVEVASYGGYANGREFR